eukprot:11990853-Alexandrium_andersonii.AAC.1
MPGFDFRVWRPKTQGFRLRHLRFFRRQRFWHPKNAPGDVFEIAGSWRSNARAAERKSEFVSAE